MKISNWGIKENFLPVPSDWLVVIADIVDSTGAISKGRYKEVNILGAACIISVSNAISDQFTYSVFGGDGATFLVAPEHLKQVETVLGHLSHIASNQFNLQLRVGSVAVSNLRELGSDVRMAKEYMSAGFGLNLFIGGGISLADQLIKKYPELYQIKNSSKSSVKVDGLECRWNDVPSTRGKIMTLMVKPLLGGVQGLQEVFQAIDKLLPNAQPIRKLNLPLTHPPKHLMSEIKAKISSPILQYLNYIGILAMTAVISIFIRRDNFNPATTIGQYCLSILDNTDHAKMDDVFRVVLDLTNEEIESLEKLLEEKKQLKILDYGVHYSNSALMTCFVRTLGHHMHFVDGADGGYAAASYNLKNN